MTHGITEAIGEDGMILGITQVTGTVGMDIHITMQDGMEDSALIGESIILISDLAFLAADTFPATYPTLQDSRHSKELYRP